MSDSSAEEDLRATIDSVGDDAEKLAALEEAKGRLDPADPRMTELEKARIKRLFEGGPTSQALGMQLLQRFMGKQGPTIVPQGATAIDGSGRVNPTLCLLWNPTILPATQTPITKRISSVF